MICFADTNFFLECKSPQDLDWKKLTTDAEIFLYICYPVIQEIDKHKHNQQKSRKTKRIQQLLNEMLNNNNKKEYTFKNHQKLTVKIAEKYSMSELKTVENLEMEVKDDEIIATIVLFNKKNESNAVLLTHDYGMRLKANSFFEVYFVPEDWLSTETDEVQKENEKLKAELLKLQKKEPLVECSLFVNNILLHNDMREHLAFTVYDEISEEDIDYYIRQMELRCSKVKECGVLDVMKHIQVSIGSAPSQSQIDEYNEQYSCWLKHQKDVLHNFVKKHNKVFMICLVRIELKNIGTVPAESFEIEISSNTGEFFETDDLNAYKSEMIEHFQVAPEYPQGGFRPPWRMGLAAPILNYPKIKILHNDSREKFRFYPIYKNGKLNIQCDEMQHQKEKYVLESYFVVDKDKIKNNKVDFSYQIYAKNLATTKTLTYTMTIDFTQTSALESIEKELRKVGCI